MDPILIYGFLCYKCMVKPGIGLHFLSTFWLVVKHATSCAMHNYFTLLIMAALCSS